MAHIHIHIHIRAHQADDVDAIVRLWWRSLAQIIPHSIHEYGPERLRAFFLERVTREQRVWVATIDDEIVGIVMTRAHTICNLHVAESHQRQGIGSRLLHEAALEMSAPIDVFTLAGNVRARRFYKKHGFCFRRSQPSALSGYLEVVYRRD